MVVSKSKGRREREEDSSPQFSCPLTFSGLTVLLKPLTAAETNCKPVKTGSAVLSSAQNHTCFLSPSFSATTTCRNLLIHSDNMQTRNVVEINIQGQHLINREQKLVNSYFLLPPYGLPSLRHILQGSSVSPKN